MNSIFTNVLLVVHVAVCLLLCLLVLMQRPKQEGLGAAFGGGMTDQAFGARTTDVLQKGTVYMGTMLFIVTLALAVLVGAKSKSNKVDKAVATAQTGQLSDNVEILNEAAAEEEVAPEAPAEEEVVPATEESAPAPVPAEEAPEQP